MKGATGILISGWIFLMVMFALLGAYDVEQEKKCKAISGQYIDGRCFKQGSILEVP